VVLGLHSGDEAPLRRLFHNWTFHIDVPLYCGYCTYDILRRNMHWEDQEALQSSPECWEAAYKSVFGPVLQCDGEWIMDNPAFATAHGQQVL
jgi:hypothetical protein